MDKDKSFLKLRDSIEIARDVVYIQDKKQIVQQEIKDIRNMDSDTSEDEEEVKSFEDQSSAREEQITLDISTGTKEEIQKDDKENCNYRTEENILVLENTYQGCENNTEENISSSEKTGNATGSEQKLDESLET
ncbi:hypothetical protein ACJJTC_014457 [Scirpophaga incertulas]